MLNFRLTTSGFIALCCTLFFCIISSAQSRSENIKPQWLKSEPNAYNSTYTFKTFRIQTNNLNEAKRRLPDEVSYYMERSYSVRGISIETTEVSDIYSNGSKKSLTIEKMIDTVFTESHKTHLNLRIIDEFIGKGEIYFLCALPNPHTDTAVYNQIKITTAYGIHGLWRSAIVPGWGQMYKGSYLKGGLVMGSAIALGGGAIACRLTQKDYLSKMANTHSAIVKQQYAARANNCNTGMSICLGALAALYVYNLVDAVVAPGGKRIIVYPAVASDGSAGIGGTIRF